MKFKSTIIAQCTPIGNSGIGIIKISGSKSYEISKIILGVCPKTRYAKFYKFKNNNNKILDYGIAIYFKSPKSFTGEDVLELNCHGGQKIMEKIIDTILKFKIKNIRLAKPGEFTKRAFLNNKIDLIQAESINNLINTNSTNQLNKSLLSLKGKLTDKIINYIYKINKINIFITKEINFTEKEFTYLKYKKFKKYMLNFYKKIKNLYKKNYKQSFYDNGIKIIIIGKPNVGKSSLMNNLTKYNTSIVTNISGTTRDLIKDKIYINNINIEITDSAGIQKTKNIIEKIGIKKTLNEIKLSKIILLVDDNYNISNKKFLKKNINLIKKIKKHQKLILIRNKIDLSKYKHKKHDKINNINIINISNKTKKGINILLKYIKKYIKLINNNENIFYINKRHITLIQKTNKSTKYIINKLNNFNYKTINLDILQQEISKIQKYLNQIIGKRKFTPETIINNIFKNFCIGK